MNYGIAMRDGLILAALILFCISNACFIALCFGLMSEGKLRVLVSRAKRKKRLIESKNNESEDKT